jgi:type I restriction enzyme, S subunit
LCDKLFRFRPKSDIVNYRFLVMMIRCQQSRAQIESGTNGASDSMQNIGQDVIRNLCFAIPSLAEQTRITEKSFAMTEELTMAIIRAKQEIDLLREYRTCLISDVVTGKLDVRGVELPAMDEAETLEDIDIVEDIETEAQELIESEEVADADN